MIGASVFIIAEHQVHKKFGSDGTAGAVGIVVGSVADGVPESIIFGIQLASGEPVSVAFMVVVFVSNIPQAIAPSADLVAAGWNGRRAWRLWLWVVLACDIASVLGYVAGGVFTGVNGRRAVNISPCKWDGRAGHQTRGSTHSGASSGTTAISLFRFRNSLTSGCPPLTRRRHGALPRGLSARRRDHGRNAD